jgi:hypothetical protein
MIRAFLREAHHRGAPDAALRRRRPVLLREGGGVRTFFLWRTNSNSKNAPDRCGEPPRVDT